MRQPKEQQFLKELVTYNAAEILHNQAALTLDALKLEYALVDTKLQCEAHQKTLLTFIPLTYIQLTNKEKIYKEQINHTRAMLLISQYSEEKNSPHDLDIKTSSHLLSLKLKWTDFKILTTSIQPPIQINEKLLSDFADLENDILRLNQQYTDLNTTISTQDLSFEQLKTLTSIQERAQKLLDKKHVLKNLNPKEQQQLEKTIYNFISSISASLAELEDQEIPDLLKEKFQATQQLLHEVELIMVDIIYLNQLSLLQAQCEDFDQRINNCLPGDLSVRRLLLQNIEAFLSNKLKASLQDIASSNNSYVQEKLACLLKAKSKIDFFRQIHCSSSLFPAAKDLFIQDTKKPKEQSDRALLLSYYGETMDLNDRQGIFGNYLQERAKRSGFVIS